MTEFEEKFTKEISDQVKEKYPHLNFYVHYEDPRYVTIVFNDNEDYPEYDNYAGYTWDFDTQDIERRVCTCAAWNEDECLCGAWDDKEY